MFETIRNAWKVEDLRKKILYTLLMLFIYRLGTYVPIPGINVEFIASQVEQYGLLGFMDIMNGGALNRFTIFAMGISPYINASIIMQLLTVAIPKLEAMQKEGEDGRKKIVQITRYVTVGIGFIMAVGLIVGMGPEAVKNANPFTYITIGLAMAAGTSLTMWIGERITEKGVGNGISLLIFVSIISRLPTLVVAAIQTAFDSASNLLIYPMYIIGALLIVAAVVFVDQAERRIPIQYGKRMVGRRMYGGQSTYMPLKVNSSGVLPLIFASSFITFPGLIAEFWKGSGFYTFINTYFSMSSPIYIFLNMLLILFFTYFYTSISFNPIEMSKNLQQNGGFVPGIRPGKPTSDFLMRTSSRITLFGAVFLAILATIPTVILVMSGSRSPIGATSILIVVSVALETTNQIRSQMLMRHYKGFLE